MEGVSRFHCQINRVFLKRASERFYAGLETLFQRLYRHLVHTQSSDQIVTACVECWLKMCTLVGKIFKLTHSCKAGNIILIILFCFYLKDTRRVPSMKWPSSPESRF